MTSQYFEGLFCKVLVFLVSIPHFKELHSDSHSCLAFPTQSYRYSHIKKTAVNRTLLFCHYVITEKPLILNMRPPTIKYHFFLWRNSLEIYPQNDYFSHILVTVLIMNLIGEFIALLFISICVYVLWRMLSDNVIEPYTTHLEKTHGK